MRRMTRENDRRRDNKREKFAKFTRRKVCRFCADSKLKIDYKDGRALHYFITERGKIVPRRITANCAYHQREITTAIKRARLLALIPYTATQAGA
jgi:small subunit ribosomal protein S18